MAAAAGKARISRQAKANRARVNAAAMRMSGPEVGLEEVSLGRVVAYASLCSAPGDAFKQESGTGVSRQLDVSGLHKRPGEASPNPVYGQLRQAGDSLIILCGTDRV